MLIDDIKPYERNARNNKKAIPIVAESIKEFGLRGQIVLESKENPVIVAGHTRWAACKLLGWKEIPDDKIDYCTDLTEEQIKAYRVADNKTGDIATYNKALLTREVKSLGASLDMSRFGFNFKSEHLTFGAERFKTDKGYNLDLVNIGDCEDEMPMLAPTQHIPDKLMGFNYAKSSEDTSAGLHFFIDDYQFERLWNSPRQYLDLLKKFDCVLTPDFSLYMDMPYPMQRWNIYRSRALGVWWQRQGITVIPTLSWSDEYSYEFCFDGIPKRSVVAVSTVGVMQDKRAKEHFFSGLNVALELLEPKCLLLYGASLSSIPCETKLYKNAVTERMKDGR